MECLLGSQHTPSACRPTMASLMSALPAHPNHELGHPGRRYVTPPTQWPSNGASLCWRPSAAETVSVLYSPSRDCMLSVAAAVTGNWRHYTQRWKQNGKDGAGHINNNIASITIGRFVSLCDWYVLATGIYLDNKISQKVVYFNSQWKFSHIVNIRLRENILYSGVKTSRMKWFIDVGVVPFLWFSTCM